MDEFRKFLVERAGFTDTQADDTLPILEGLGLHTLDEIEFLEPEKDLPDLPVIRRRKLARVITEEFCQSKDSI